MPDHYLTGHISPWCKAFHWFCIIQSDWWLVPDNSSLMSLNIWIILSLSSNVTVQCASIWLLSPCRLFLFPRRARQIAYTKHPTGRHVRKCSQSTSAAPLSRGLSGGAQIHPSVLWVIIFMFYSHHDLIKQMGHRVDIFWTFKPIKNHWLHTQRATVIQPGNRLEPQRAAGDWLTVAQLMQRKDY